MDNGHKDWDVLTRLRLVGLHPAVRVFEPTGDGTSMAEWLCDVVNRATTDHAPAVRLVTGSRTA